MILIAHFDGERAQNPVAFSFLKMSESINHVSTALHILPNAWFQKTIFSGYGWSKSCRNLTYNESLMMHLKWRIYQIHCYLNFCLKNKIAIFSYMFNLGHTVWKSVWQVIAQAQKKAGRKWWRSVSLLIVSIFPVTGNTKSQPCL